jgi:hypothetical protein
MRKLFVLLTLLSLIASCDSAKRLQKRLDKYCPLCVQKDSSVTVIEYRDTTITLPGDTTVVVDSIYCDSLGNVYIKRLSEKDGELVSLKNKLKNNKLTSTAIVQTKTITVPGRTITKTREVYKTLPPKHIKYIPWWVNFFAVLGGITFLLLIIYVIYKTTVGKWTRVL